MKPTALLLSALLVLAPCGAYQAAEAKTRVAATAGAALTNYLKAEWNWNMAQDPVWASYQGDRRYNTRWRDLSPKAIAARIAHQKNALMRLKAIERSRLSAADQLNYDLYLRDLGLWLEDAALKSYLMPLNHMGGIHTDFELADTLRFETVKDYEDWIARLRAFPVYMDQTIAVLREGRKAGLMPPKAILSRMTDAVHELATQPAEQSPWFKPFEKFAAGISEPDRTRLTAAAKAAIAGAITPSYAKFESYFNRDYLPFSPDTVGLWHLPNGAALYALNARTVTTTNLPPATIHRMGLAEVTRIRGEMEGVMAKVGFKGTLKQFFDSLKTDPRFYRQDGKALLEEYRATAKRIDPLLVKLFKTLPRMPYGVEPIPEAMAPNSSAAYYNRPAADGSRAGTFHVNLYKPEKRPTYEMTALVLHETVPGHHLQIALAQELGALPEFRRFGGYTAYIEGWGLYAESLGREMGLYEDPYTYFGKLNMEMRRALRLVLDTGLHHERWDRQRAIAFFLENAAKSELEATNEVDRYLAWPGQALSYKVGELKLQELRKRAETRLGSRFDIKVFHEQVLAEGALPLDILERRFDAWLKRQQ